jgi:hypothetical protein
MSNTYRIDGAGDAQAVLDASDLASKVLAETGGVGGTTNAFHWLNYTLSGIGASLVAALVMQPVVPAVAELPGLAIAIVVGVSFYVLALVLFNRRINKGTARAYLDEPIMKNHHVRLSVEGMRVVSGKTYTLFHWSDVTRIEAIPNVILVMAGMSWAYIPVANFADQDQAKAALADMRAWQAAARA